MTIPFSHRFRPLQKRLSDLSRKHFHRLLLAVDGDTAERLAIRAGLLNRPVEQVAAALLREAVLQADARQKIDLWKTLTRREQEVAACACRGLSYHEISASLHIEPGTVHTHLKHIYQKMGVGGKQHLRVLLQDWDFQQY